MSTDAFKDWNDGDAPLRGRDVAGTLRFLRDGLQALQAQGLVAEGVADVVVSDDERSFHFVTSSGRALAEVDLPPAPWRWRLEGRVQGAAYFEGDAFYVDELGSSYLTLVDHNASADIQTDLTSQPPRLTLLAKGGSAGQAAKPGGQDIFFSRRGAVVQADPFLYRLLVRDVTIPARMEGCLVKSSYATQATNVEVRFYNNGAEFARAVIFAGGTDSIWTVFPQNAKVLKAGTYVTAMLYLSTANTAVGDNSYFIAGGLAVA